MNEQELHAKRVEVEGTRLPAFNPGHRTLYEVGGLSLIVCGICLFFGTFSSLIPGVNGWAEPPWASAESFINVLASHARTAYVTWSIFTVIDFLALPAALAVYFALRGFNRDALLVGLGIILMSAILDAAVAEVGFFTATSLSVSYAAATDPVMKAAYLVAATHAVLQTEFAWPYSYFTGWAGWLIISAVMRKSFFGKWLGTYGVVVSALFMAVMGSVYIAPGVASAFVLPLEFAFVAFYAAAGVRLLKFGRKQTQAYASSITNESAITTW